MMNSTRGPGPLLSLIPRMLPLGSIPRQVGVMGTNVAARGLGVVTTDRKN